MLFNSHVFLLGFLPIALLGFFCAARWLSRQAALAWLLAASLFFFGWWSVPYMLMFVALVVLNWLAGRAIAARAQSDRRFARIVCVLGIALDLGVLAWFKYATFVVENIEALTGLDFAMRAIVLPLAISFYTFQQIAYLCDMLQSDAPRYSLLEYALFVSFFPQLIAGPIVHHYEMIPQLRARRFGRFDHADFAAGLAFVAIGLVKKVVIADSVAVLADEMFHGAAPPPLVDAWIGVSAFTVGLYFDFSGYCDIAIGLARMVGVRLPYNFNSPYRATSIIDFWRRWHITLSRFLRDYLYIALGGNRLGAVRRYVNLMITMLLGGLWHGAAWTFVIWGALHGAFLMVNHAWNALRVGPGGARLELPDWAARVLTLLAVMAAWVFFRAPDFTTAGAVLKGMVGLNGWVAPDTASALISAVLEHGFIEGVPLVTWWVQIHAYVLLLAGFAMALFAPNSQEIVDDLDAGVRGGMRLRFQPTVATALTAAGTFLATLALMSDIKAFVYFQF